MLTIDKMQKDSLAYKLYKRVKAGEKRTINEWAEEFNTLPYAIQSALGRLRKADAHLHPLNISRSGEVKPGRGVVVDIMEKQEWFENVYERGMRNNLLPSIFGFTHKSQLGSEVFPQLRHQIVVAVNGVYSYIKQLHDGFGHTSPEKSAEHQSILKQLLGKIR